MVEIYWKNKYRKRKCEVLKVKKLMVLGVCVVIASAIVLSACTEIIQSGEAANTSNPEEITSTLKKTESPKTTTAETAKTFIPGTPGKVSGVPVEQSPDVFDGAIIKRDEMLKGEDIPFKVESKQCSGQARFPKIWVFIIKSSEELAIANKEAFQEKIKDYANSDKYNDEYFKENALIFFIRAFVSGSYRMSMDSIIKNNHELSFNIKVTLPEANIRTDSNGQTHFVVTDDGWVVGNYIELKKAEIADVSNVSYFETYGLH